MLNSGDSSASSTTNTCQYPSKRCEKPRVLKRNGELHKLCEFHRQKANFNQRRLEFKRKVTKVADIPDFTPSQPLCDEQFMALRAILPRAPSQPSSMPMDDLLPIDLDEEDIRILEELVSNFNDEDDVSEGGP
jgi:hypothetical protein